MQNPRINLLRKNSKFYKLDFGINKTAQSEDFHTIIFHINQLKTLMKLRIVFSNIVNLEF